MSIQSEAYNATKKALWNGAMKREDRCEGCGGSALYPHHPNYFEHLIVVWFCSRCHQRWHRLNGPGKGANLTSLASRIEHRGIISQYIPSYVEELRRQITESGAYMGLEGKIRASAGLCLVLKVGYVRDEK